MNSNQQMYILFSPEIEELLADNQTSIGELLKREGVDVKEVFAKDPAKAPDSMERDAVLILFSDANCRYAAIRA